MKTIIALFFLRLYLADDGGLPCGCALETKGPRPENNMTRLVIFNNIQVEAGNVETNGTLAAKKYTVSMVLTIVTTILCLINTILILCSKPTCASTSRPKKNGLIQETKL